MTSSDTLRPGGSPALRRIGCRGAWIGLLSGFMAASACGEARAQDRAQDTGHVAIQGGTVIPISGPVIENGTVVLHEGKIAAVGRDVSVPAGAVVIDASGKYVMPGLIDAMSHYGIDGSDLNETSSAVTPELRVIEAYYPFGDFGSGRAASPNAQDLLSGGITSQYIATADGTVIGGQGAVVKTAGPDFASLVLLEPAAMDMTLGSQPAKTFRDSNRAPSSRLAVASQLRQTLIEAREYDERRRAHEALPDHERESSPQAARDLGMEALGRLLRREMPARIQANRTTEIRLALQLAEEFGFDLIIESGNSAYEMADELARRGVPVVLGPVSHPYISGEEIPDRDEYPRPDERSAAWLTEAGVKLAFATFSRSFGSFGRGTGKWLLLDASVAGGYGMRESEILRAVTLSSAEILGVSERIGSLEVGKDADIIILDGPPLSVKSWVERVWVNGKQVYERTNASDR